MSSNDSHINDFTKHREYLSKMRIPNIPSHIALDSTKNIVSSLNIASKT